MIWRALPVTSFFGYKIIEACKARLYYFMYVGLVEN